MVQTHLSVNIPLIKQISTRYFWVPEDGRWYQDFTATLEKVSGTKGPPGPGDTEHWHFGPQPAPEHPEHHDFDE